MTSSASADFVYDRDGTPSLFITGRVDAAAVPSLWKNIQKKLPGQCTETLLLDIARIRYLDTAGAVFISRLLTSGLSKKFSRVRLGEQGNSEILERIKTTHRLIEGKTQTPDAKPLSFVESTGRQLHTALSETKTFITLTGEITWALVQSLKTPQNIRWADTLVVAEKAGVNALPIVALISFIVGLVMAFQAAVPMRMFGAELYVANLIGITMVRELGPLMTAIVLTGRSASAFAAEIGTMKINEEIDALAVMGLDPVKFLIVPRIIASTVITPLLTIFSNLVGMLGGALVITSMGYPIISYYNQIASFVKWNDFAGGLVKCFVFGILIAVTGCICGYQAKTGPSAVGEATTRAVVTGIILIAVFDGIFSIVYYYLGI